MMSFIRGIFGLALAVLVTAFAVFNRETVSLAWSPLHDPQDLPLYAVGLGMMAVGFVLGGVMVWLNQGTVRKTKRKQSKQIKSLEKELESINENIKSGMPASDFFPALPKK